MLQFRSTILSSIFTLRFQYIITPSKIKIDYQNKVITTSQRNWYLIGADTNTISFSVIRRIDTNSYLFGADLHIKAFGTGVVSVYSISKRDAKVIQNSLLELNSKSKMIV
jgi:hypothetical protein